MDTSLDGTMDAINFPHLRYVGCLQINTSMKSLDFDTRSQIAKECINRVCEAGGLKTADKKRRIDKRMQRMLAEKPNMEHAGANVSLTVTSAYINLTILETQEVIARHDMPNISFASGGDADTLDFVAYVAKDMRFGRACFVLECGDRLAQEVITTIGQAFQMRFKEFLKRAPRSTTERLTKNLALNGGNSHSVNHVPSQVQALASSSTSGHVNNNASVAGAAAGKSALHPGHSEEERDYYNDLPGKVPPDLPSRSAAASSNDTLGANIPPKLVSPKALPRPSKKNVMNVTSSLTDDGTPNLIDFNTDPVTPSLTPIDPSLSASPDSSSSVSTSKNLVAGSMTPAAVSKPCAIPPVNNSTPLVVNSSSLSSISSATAVPVDTPTFTNGLKSTLDSSSLGGHSNLALEPDLFIEPTATAKAGDEAKDPFDMKPFSSTLIEEVTAVASSTPNSTNSSSAKVHNRDINPFLASAGASSLERNESGPMDKGLAASPVPNVTQGSSALPSAHSPPLANEFIPNALSIGGNSFPTTPIPGTLSGGEASTSIPPPPLINEKMRKELIKEIWFHGPISRKESETLVVNDGDFLVRESLLQSGQYVLTGMQGGIRKHLLLVDPEGIVRTKDKTFDSVSHLINYHRNYGLPITSAESIIVLRNPIRRPPEMDIQA